jgi:hypothetical protein
MTAPDMADDDDFLSHDPVPLRPVPVETVTEWEPGTFIENLAPTPDGGWLVTIPSHDRVDRVEPGGGHEVFAELDRHPTGIVADGAGAWVLNGTIGEVDWQLSRLDGDGHKPVCDLPELIFGNGMERAGERLLAVDSVRGLVLSIDPRHGTSAVRMQHGLLTGPNPDIPMPGANGIAVHEGWVYVSNTGRGLLLRFPLHGADPAARLEVVAERLVSDDFDIHPDGRIYLATHFLHSVLRLDQDGSRADIAGLNQGVAGSTSAAVDPRDPDVLYVTTTGGMNGLDLHSGEPGRLLRLRLQSG